MECQECCRALCPLEAEEGMEICFDCSEEEIVECWYEFGCDQISCDHHPTGIETRVKRKAGKLKRFHISNLGSFGIGLGAFADEEGYVEYDPEEGSHVATAVNEANEAAWEWQEQNC